MNSMAAKDRGLVPPILVRIEFEDDDMQDARSRTRHPCPKSRTDVDDDYDDVEDDNDNEPDHVENWSRLLCFPASIS